MSMVNSVDGAKGWNALPQGFRSQFSLGYNDCAEGKPLNKHYDKWDKTHQKTYEDGRQFFTEVRSKGYAVRSGPPGDLDELGKQLMSKFDPEVAPEYIRFWRYCSTVETRGNTVVYDAEKEEKLY